MANPLYTAPTVNVTEWEDTEVTLDDFSWDDIVEYIEQGGCIVTDQGTATVNFTGSVQDAELTEAITDAYAKHGPRLAELIRNL